MTHVAGPHFWLAIVTWSLFAMISPAAQAHSPASDALSRAGELRDSGDFKGAARLLTAALQAPGLSAAEQKQLEFQRDVLKRIQHDYSLTREQLFQKLTASLKDLTRQEFEQWLAGGLVRRQNH